MRKKFAAVMLAGSMVASMAACGNKTDTKETSKAPETEVQTTTEAPETEVSTTKAPETEADTEETSAEEETTEAVTTEAPETEEETTEEGTTEAQATEEETTEAQATAEASNDETTEGETTEDETTESETTEGETVEDETTEGETAEDETTEGETAEDETTEGETAEDETTGEETSAEPETDEEEETEEVLDGSGIKVGMITDTGGVNDGSFNQSAWDGLQAAEEAFGVQVDYLESKNDSDYAPNIENFVDEEYDLIVVVGYKMATALSEAAEMYPDQKFVIIDDATNGTYDNVTCLMFESAQSSYLVGLAAGMTTETDTVGFVLGMASDMMHEFGYGYIAGVKAANEDATILQFNANSFGDTAIGKNAAVNMVTNGADVIFHAAGATGLGVIDGCKESGIWAIGVDSDQSVQAPETVLTSAMKRVDNGCYEAIKSYIKGELEGGVITYDLEVGGVDIAPTTDNLSEEVLEAVEQAKQDIIDGTIVVPSNKEEFEAIFGEDLYELD